MVAGTSGATPGSGGADDEDDKDGRLMPPQPARHIVSAEAIARLEIARTLHKVNMASPEQNSRPHPSRSQA
jgi:hypothetical protein